MASPSLPPVASHPPPKEPPEPPRPPGVQSPLPKYRRAPARHRGALVSATGKARREGGSSRPVRTAETVALVESIYAAATSA